MNAAKLSIDVHCTRATADEPWLPRSSSGRKARPPVGSGPCGGSPSSLTLNGICRFGERGGVSVDARGCWFLPFLRRLQLEKVELERMALRGSNSKERVSPLLPLLCAITRYPQFNDHNWGVFAAHVGFSFLTRHQTAMLFPMGREFSTSS